MKTKLLKKMRKRASAQFKVEGKDVLRATNGTKHHPPYSVMYTCESEKQAEELCRMEKRLYILHRYRMNLQHDTYIKNNVYICGSKFKRT